MLAMTQIRVLASCDTQAQPASIGKHRQASASIGKHRQASASIGKHHYSTIIQHIQPRCDSETFLNQKTSQKAVGSVLPLDVAGGLEMPTIIPKVTTINTASTGVVGHNFACPCRTRSDQDHLQSLKCE